MQLAQLLLADFGGRIGHLIRRRLGLRESDHVANAVGARHQHRQTIEAEGDAAMRGRAELQCIQQEAELLLRGLSADAQQLQTPPTAAPGDGCAPSHRRSPSR